MAQRVEIERKALKYIRNSREFSQLFSKLRLFFLSFGFTLFVFEVLEINFKSKYRYAEARWADVSMSWFWDSNLEEVQKRALMQDILGLINKENTDYMDFMDLGYQLRDDINITNYAYHIAHLKNHQNILANSNFSLDENNQILLLSNDIFNFNFKFKQ